MKPPLHSALQGLLTDETVSAPTFHSSTRQGRRVYLRARRSISTVRPQPPAADKACDKDCGSPPSTLNRTNDALDRRTLRVDDGAVTNAFGYNPRSELTTALMDTNAYSYAYDGIGNRLTATNNGVGTTYWTNPLNQYTNILCASAPPREISPAYDLDGNMLTNGVWSYAWDGENRLAAVYSNSVLVVSNAYDHQSRRVLRVSHGGTETRRFIYDGWNLVAELTHTQTHTLTNLYIWGLDLSGSLQGAGGIGGLLAVVRDGEPFLPCYDANGNVTEYLSTNGTVVAHYEYSPFGETIARSGNLADAFAFRFSTKYHDDKTGLYYYGYRFYSPDMMRFLNRDPIEEHSGPNLYEFCENDPLNRVDVLGMASIGTKITLIFLSRVLQTPVFFGFLNQLISSYTITDDENEMDEALQIFTGPALRKEICSRRGSITADWKRMTISDVNMAQHNSPPYFSIAGGLLGFWLSSSANVTFTGTVEARCEKDMVHYRRSRGTWKWHDDIDANSFPGISKLKGDGKHVFQEAGIPLAVIEGLWDIIGDSLLNTDFRVVVKWNHNRPEELVTSCK